MRNKVEKRHILRRCGPINITVPVNMLVNVIVCVCSFETSMDGSVAYSISVGSSHAKHLVVCCLKVLLVCLEVG